MAALQSTLETSRGKTVSSTQNHVARVMAATWDVEITTVLQKDGSYVVTVADRDTGKVLRTLEGRYTSQDGLQEVA